MLQIDKRKLKISRHAKYIQELTSQLNQIKNNIESLEQVLSKGINYIVTQKELKKKNYWESKRRYLISAKINIEDKITSLVSSALVKLANWW